MTGGPPEGYEKKKVPQTKAERRALQEAQRAAKEAAKAAAGGGGGGDAKGGGGGGGGGGGKGGGGDAGKGGGGGGGSGGGSGGGGGAASAPSGGKPSGAPVSTPRQFDVVKERKDLQKKQVAARTVAAKQVALFAHLPQYEKEESISEKAVANGKIHPAVLRFGLQLAEGVISGTNARVVGMLRSFQSLIRDFEAPANKNFSRELDGALKTQIQYLVDCRPQSMAMGNGIKWIKKRVQSTPPHLSPPEVKERLIESIETFIAEKIQIADQAIIAYAATRIAPGDVILVFTASAVVEHVLLHTMRQGVQFRVIVADAGPKFEGRELMQRLLLAGLRCTYVNLHALSYMMPEVSKLFLGASSMLLNGTLMARSGTALVCMLAHEHGVPALVCCETYKFADRVLLDSICFNELSDPDELIPAAERPKGLGGVGLSGAGSAAIGSGAAKEPGTPNRVADWRDIPRLKLLNLLYDATPMKYLTMVVTEVGVIPPSAVPAVIRESAAREEREENEERRRDRAVPA